MLTTTIRAAGLGWVVDEVADLIQQGLEREISASEWTGKRKPTRDEARITRREYTPLERVQLLIDATARVVKQGYEVEDAVARFFRKPDQAEGDDTETAAPSPVGVRFMPEDSDADLDRSDGFALAHPAPTGVGNHCPVLLELPRGGHGAVWVAGAQPGAEARPAATLEVLASLEEQLADAVKRIAGATAMPDGVF